jgi:hypothetical protein
MTTQQAAKDIYFQTGAPWAECMRWAAACKREATSMREQRAASARAAFFLARREAVKVERYLTRLRSAKLLTGKETGTGRATGLFPEGVACAYFPAREESA